MEREAQIRRFYAVLSAAWGPQHWWPARSRFEVIIGAYLTQNTCWRNVELAMGKLRRERVLSLRGIREIPLARLEELVRPAGYFRQKAERLKTFVAFLDAEYGGSLERMFSQRTPVLREQLLALNGIGPETADSILLYGGNHPVFVVDAYTRRILHRHGIIPAGAPYEEIRALFERSLGELNRSVLKSSESRERSTQEGRERLAGAAHRPSRMSLLKRGELVQRFNEMHALIVGVGKNHCFNKAPVCERCPLQPMLRGVAEKSA